MTSPYDYVGLDWPTVHAVHADCEGQTISVEPLWLRGAWAVVPDPRIPRPKVEDLAWTVVHLPSRHGVLPSLAFGRIAMVFAIECFSRDPECNAVESPPDWYEDALRWFVGWLHTDEARALVA